MYKTLNLDKPDAPAVIKYLQKKKKKTQTKNKRKKQEGRDGPGITHLSFPDCVV